MSSYPLFPNTIAEGAAFRHAFGIGSRGASLTRPDGYIAWRAEDLPTELAAALTDILGRVSSARRYYVNVGPTDIKPSTSPRTRSGLACS